MSGQESEPSQHRMLTIQKSPQRTFQHLKGLGRTAGFAIFSAVFYLLYWKDLHLRQHYATLFWWLAFIFGVVSFWWSEYSKLRGTPKQVISKRVSHHFKTLGKIASIVISSVIVDLVILKNNPMAEQFETTLQCLTLIFAALAIWWLLRDWFMTSEMTFVFDGGREIFIVRDKDRERLQLGFQAIKRVKVDESSNLFPVYTLYVHLQDGQVIEIDTSVDQDEINSLANQISEMTGAPILVQHYDEQLTKEEKEEQMWQQREIYRGD